MQHNQFNTNNAHFSINSLVIISAIISVISLIFKQFLSIDLFSLTHETLFHKLYLWQSISSLLVIPSKEFSTTFFLNLVFKLLIIWGFCHFLAEKKGGKPFWTTLALSSIIIALSAIAAAWFSSSNTPINTNTLLIATLATSYFIWSSPKTKLPIPAHHSRAGQYILLGSIILFLGIEQFNQGYEQIVLVMNAILMTVLIEKKMIRSGFSKKSPSSLFYKTQKAINAINHDLLLDDEQFMEAMLSKISLYGKKVLTEEERIRMEIISMKKEPTNTNNFRP